MTFDINSWISSPFLSRLADLFLIFLTIAFVLGLFTLFIKFTKITRIFGPKNIGVELLNADDLKKLKDKEWSLLDHKLFKFLERYRYTSFLKMSSTEQYTIKDAINNTFLRDCKFKIIGEILFYFIKDLEKTSGKDIEEFPSVINRIVETYEQLAKKILIELPNGKKIYGVPDCYINKFNYWHSDHIKLCLDGIYSVLAEKVYDWKIKAAFCLEYIYVCLQLTLDDAKKTLSNLNGDLDKEISEKVKEQN
jgi:hypothetical protein